MTPVNLQLWDRMPRTESSAVAVNLIDVKPELSTDAPYVRLMRPDNLLRWDLTVPPGTIGDKALEIAYQFKLSTPGTWRSSTSAAAGWASRPSGAWAAWAAGCARGDPPGPGR